MPGIVALPNSVESLQPLMASGRIPLRRVYGMLLVRSAIPFGLLVALSAALALAGKGSPVSASAAWWLWFVTAANVASLLLLRRFSRAEGMRIRDIFYLSKSTWKGDLAWSLVGLAGMPCLPSCLGRCSQRSFGAMRICPMACCSCLSLCGLSTLSSC